eukprot:sb/3469295/
MRRGKTCFRVTNGLLTRSSDDERIWLGDINECCSGTDRNKLTTNQNSVFRSRDWLSTNQGPVFTDSVGSYLSSEHLSDLCSKSRQRRRRQTDTTVPLEPGTFGAQCEQQGVGNEVTPWPCQRVRCLRYQSKGGHKFYGGAIPHLTVRSDGVAAPDSGIDQDNYIIEISNFSPNVDGSEEDVVDVTELFDLDFDRFVIFSLIREPTETSKQPIRICYLGHVTGYHPIRDQYSVGS